MDHLQRLRVFARIAENGSFTKTATQLHLTKPAVTQAVQQLEAHLRVRLLQRTTRKVALTEEGTAYYTRCLRILSELDDADAMFAKQADRPRGIIRVDLPEGIAFREVIPTLPAFFTKYPELQLVLSVSDRFTDLMASGIDCLVRVGAVENSSFSVRRIGLLEQVNVASRAYVERCGIPQSLAELRQHMTVGYATTRTVRDYDFDYEEDGELKHVPMRGLVSVSSSQAYSAACLAGLGIIQAPRHGMQRYLATGELVAFLPQFRPPPLPISILHAHGRKLAPRVRVFLDWLTAQLPAGLH